IPVLTQENYQGVLRFSAPTSAHTAAHAQALRALRMWNGHGAVRVIRDDRSFRATLPERLRTKDDLSVLALAGVPPGWGARERCLSHRASSHLMQDQDIPAVWRATGHDAGRQLPGRSEAGPHDRLLLSLVGVSVQSVVRSGERWRIHSGLRYLHPL